METPDVVFSANGGPQICAHTKHIICTHHVHIRHDILIGFFKKVVIADSLAPMVDFTFNNYHDLSSLSLLLGALFFSIQIYCDFSGYSDIAIGVLAGLGVKGYLLAAEFAVDFIKQKGKNHSGS